MSVNNFVFNKGNILKRITEFDELSNEHLISQIIANIRTYYDNIEELNTVISNQSQKKRKSFTSNNTQPQARPQARSQARSRSNSLSKIK